MNTITYTFITAFISSVITLCVPYFKVYYRRLKTRNKRPTLQQQIATEVAKQLKEILND